MQAARSAVLLDDWFQIRYWRDHALGVASLWAYAEHNYFHYNPRIGELFLAVIDGSRAIHVVVTPLVQLAVLPVVFAIAFARWPRRTLRDLQQLLLIQTLIWLVIPIPGIMYFYRPFATNYVWAFTLTLALFVPYRLELARAADPARPRRWLMPIMLVAGWVAGMCNEHTGPTAMLAMASFVIAAWRLRRLRAWMLAGAIGLYLGYPMLFFAPGQAVRYGGMAVRDTPLRLLADRGVAGCLAIMRDFVFESRLGILVVVAAIVRYALTLHVRGERIPPPPRDVVRPAAVLAAAALAIVATLFASPIATDRVFYASGILLVAAFAVGAQHLFAERGVRRFVVAACVLVLGYHAVCFVATSSRLAAENAQRLAILDGARPGSIALVPSYSELHRSRWQLGDDFLSYPWLRGYVGGELFDLARVDVDRRDPAPVPRFVVAPVLLAPPPTYRQLQRPVLRWLLGGRFTITAVGVFDDPRGRPVVVLDGNDFVDGRPDDAPGGHVIRITGAPPRVVDAYVIGCDLIDRVELRDGALPVDERYCRGPFTAIVCEPDRCWLAGWY